MIVRIATEGQYEVLERDVETLEALDHQAVTACEAADEEEFHASFSRLLGFLRQNGRPLPEDELAPSDLILPPPDVSLEEARAEFSGDGLIPS
jgi:hypothetical protein